MRKIFLVTERRADYSRFKPILKLIQKDNNLSYDLVVTGLHLKDEHGKTINEISKDGFEVFSTFEMFLEDKDTGGAMVRSFATALKEITYALELSKPDIILSGFDIAANFAVAVAGAHMNIPVTHIQGGEVTGTIDESIRHAMSKFSHYHFAANEDARERLIKMGEIPSNVFNVGCPSIDAILQVSDNPNILKKYNLSKDFYIMLQHPVTSEIHESENQITHTIDAIIESKIEALVVLPNNDAGFSKIMSKIKASNLKFVETLSIADYVNLLKRSSGLIGNSSSGIHETATFNIPTINIGTRQQGRLRSNNVIDVDYNKNEILNAILESKKLIGKEFKKIYGDGDSSEKIVELLKTIEIGNHVIQKQITY
jgi:GDP/UDP-N,N'-diacetylbacillosamine 2-epimerase (hydrolysing)